MALVIFDLALTNWVLASALPTVSNTVWDHPHMQLFIEDKTKISPALRVGDSWEYVTLLLWNKGWINSYPMLIPFLQVSDLIMPYLPFMVKKKLYLTFWRTMPQHGENHMFSQKNSETLDNRQNNSQRRESNFSKILNINEQMYTKSCGGHKDLQNTIPVLKEFMD